MGKSPIFLGAGSSSERRRECRERSSDFSLRYTELRWSSCVGPRLKVGVLVEGKAWTPKPGVFVRYSSEKFGRPYAELTF